MLIYPASPSDASLGVVAAGAACAAAGVVGIGPGAFAIPMPRLRPATELASSAYCGSFISLSPSFAIVSGAGDRRNQPCYKIMDGWREILALPGQDCRS